jgi:tetratricopeptide (TPR) repeat protein
LRRALADDGGTMHLNNVAYQLADANVSMDDAEKYADQALRQVQAESLKTADDRAALTNTVQVGYIWDTVGWVDYRRGNYESALKYVHASWLLSQSAAVGDHLGQIYEKLGKKQEAAHAYQLALASGGGNAEDIRKRYASLTGDHAQDVDAPVLRRGSKGAFTPSPGEELSRMRSVRVTATPHETTSATFSIVFSPGKTEDVKYVSGSELLKPMTAQIAAAKFKVEFPDAGPVRLMRQGILACTKVSGCDIVLLLPNDVQHVDLSHAAD